MKNLLSAFKTAYNALFESESEEHIITFTAKDEYDTIPKLLDLYKNTVTGVIILDPESPKPTACHVYSLKDELSYDSKKDKRDEYSEYTDYTIKLNHNLEITKLITELIYNIGMHGNSGHYFDIKFVPQSNKGKVKTFGWDGDGSDYIDMDTIKIDGNAYFKNRPE